MTFLPLDAVPTPSATPNPEPSIKNLDDVKEAAENAVVATVDLAQVLLISVVSAVIGWVIALVILAIGRIVFRRRPAFLAALHSLKYPLSFTLATFSGRLGLIHYLWRFSDEHQPTWGPGIQHFLLILCIGGVTWLVCAIINAMAKAYLSIVAQVAVEREKRAQTQIQILRRVLIALACVIGLASMLMTFPAARAAGTSLVASAGIVSVVVGMAAQNTLGNIFAGLQLAASDSIRLGDIVMWDQQMSTVEEITLSYVVLKVWDGRRLIVPSQKMVSTPFENWTRKDSALMGIVELRVDWRANIDALRKQLDRILASTDLWDGRTGTLTVSDVADPHGMKINLVVSAATPGELTDLRNLVREQMIVWMQGETAEFFMHSRMYTDDGKEEAGAVKVKDSFDDVRLRHEQEREKEEAEHIEKERQALALRKDPITGDFQETAILDASELAETLREVHEAQAHSPEKKKNAAAHLPQRISIEERFKEHSSDAASLAEPETATKRTTHESSLFSGSAEADKLGHEFAGPESAPHPQDEQHKTSHTPEGEERKK